MANNAANRRVELVTDQDPPAEPNLDGRAALIVTHGRGGTGKSTFARVMVERAEMGGRPTVVADADRTNATLPGFFEGVLRPEYPDDQTVTEWLDKLINQMADERRVVVLDMGGGDQVFKRFARSLELVDLLTGAKVEPCALHFIGPDLDDLAYLRDIEDGNAFCPPHTALILNEGLIKDGRPREAAFQSVREHPIYWAAVKRGCVEIWFPKLGCMQDINARHLSFTDAETSKALGLTNRQRVSVWRRQMEQALQPIASWLP
jgi:hypothetical protein